MAWEWLKFGRKPVSKEILEKEITDFDGLQKYTETYLTELSKKIIPVVKELKEKSAKGKSLKDSDVKVLQNFEEVIGKAIGKYEKIKDTIQEDSKLTNVKGNHALGIIRNLIQDLASPKNKITGLSTAAQGSASEAMVKLESSVKTLEAQREILEGIDFNVKILAKNLQEQEKLAA